MEPMLWLIAGAAYVALLILALRWLVRRRGFRWLREHWVYALVLVQTAAQYALWAGASPSPEDRMREMIGLALFGSLAVAGLRWPLVLGLGWLVHPVWDVMLHPMPATDWVPVWFPLFCVGFDAVLGLYILMKWRGTADV